MDNIETSNEPTKSHKKPKKRKTRKIFKFLIFLIIVGIIILWVLNRDTKAPSPQTNQQPFVQEEKTHTKLKTFSGQEFSDLYNSFAYPNTQTISEETPITSDQAADKVIRELAVARGYKIRSAPVTDTFIEISQDMRLQQRAAVDWLKMQEAARKDGNDIQAEAAYRSAEDQNVIFNARLSSIPLASIVARKVDAAVDRVLQTTAVPGYSRHHTGYTVDISCYTDVGKKFEYSKCFKWLSDNNYKNAKTFGWIPSYPDGAGKQGPEPEPWEYVWVGTDVLYE